MSTSPPPIIRHARLADLEPLLALEQASFAHDRISRAQWRRHLQSHSACVIVATQARCLLGSAVVLFRRGTRVARLYSLATDVAARGRGVGTALLLAAEQAARRRGCRSVRLEVRADNAAARMLYERAGYVQIAHLAGYYEDGADALRYDKPLPNASDGI
ncbi:MAG TPA: GNAT family N-acetyltransferase [Oleiagrimonas sp.]|nr:GNAT family N-acetyltransferase [Oleiagrimonas sp.]